ncbi:MAG: hypothetical protein M4579_004383 [Chaenotheca gracillima]|nr:MAG: hypothetical protein M4579_004383 [Chaenotheca gracillima]
MAAPPPPVAVGHVDSGPTYADDWESRIEWEKDHPEPIVTEQVDAEPQRKRGRYRITGIQIVSRSRLLIRVLATIIALLSFVLILFTVVYFLKGQKNLPNAAHVNIRPSLVFTGIGGVSTVLSFVLSILCCASKKVRNVTHLSNAIFALVGSGGFAAWMSGCFFLDRSASSQSLWWWACAEMYESNPNFDYAAICRVTEVSWHLGILQACFELLTVFNVIVGFFILKWTTFRNFGRL